VHSPRLIQDECISRAGRERASTGTTPSLASGVSYVPPAYELAAVTQEV